jgi:hypothetical protein
MRACVSVVTQGGHAAVATERHGKAVGSAVQGYHRLWDSKPVSSSGTRCS